MIIYPSIITSTSNLHWEDVGHFKSTYTVDSVEIPGISLVSSLWSRKHTHGKRALDFRISNVRKR